MTTTQELDIALNGFFDDLVDNIPVVGKVVKGGIGVVKGLDAINDKAVGNGFVARVKNKAAEALEQQRQAAAAAAVTQRPAGEMKFGSTSLLSDNLKRQLLANSPAALTSNFRKLSEAEIEALARGERINGDNGGGLPGSTGFFSDPLVWGVGALALGSVGYAVWKKTRKNK